MWYYAWTKATIPKCSESASERFGRIYVLLCLVWLPFRPYLSPTACCQPASASPLQISSTGIPPSLAFWSARILAVRELYLPASAPCSAPSQICHSLQPPATAESRLQLGFVSGRWARSDVNGSTAAPKTGLKVFITPESTVRTN